MPLFNSKAIEQSKVIATPPPVVQAPSPSINEEMRQLIQRRRYQLLVHSLFYYELDLSVIDDYTWQKWAEELVSLQTKYPEEASRVVFHKHFKDFDPSTGYDLPYRDEQIVNIAGRLLRSGLCGEASFYLESLNRVDTTPAEYSRNKVVKKKPSASSKGGKHIEQPRKKLLF